MNTLPLVSVIVPSYNHERFVEQTIHAILNQKYKNIELIVIDDGSKDKSPELLEKLSNKHGFYYERTKNNGLPATLNYALDKCKGKYICFCASDDVWLNNKIEIQVNFHENNRDVYLSFGKADILQNDDTAEFNLPGKIPDKIEYKELTFKNFLLLESGVSPLTAMFKKEVFEIVGKYDTRYKIEDYYMWLKISNRELRTVELNVLMGLYRRHDDNISKKTYLMYTSEKEVAAEYANHPLYPTFLKERSLHFLLHLSLYHKNEAFAIIIKYPSMNAKWFLGLILLVLPRTIGFMIMKPILKRFQPFYLFMIYK
ncbi:MAG: glycosyltransferase [Flavobacteriales bacterium]|nr:glycosyltransferase [Flavobacteriales bacterium]